MSAGVNVHPNSLANLMPAWQAGKTPNPGGNRKGTPHADAAYAKLSCMSLEDLHKYNPPNVVEYAVKQGIIRACEAPDWQAAHAALKELADRLDGKPEQRKVVEHTVSAETRQQVVGEAYFRFFAATEEEEALASVRAIYAAKRAEDEALMRQRVQEAIAYDSEAIATYLVEAERVVTGGG